MRWSRLFALAALGALANGLNAQALENVIIETYHVQEPEHAGEQKLTTYRIYIDLAAGHKLQMVYGSREHRIELSTTTSFWNDTINGAVFADKIPVSALNTDKLALDSWLTIAAGSNAHIAIPKEKDPDGSLLKCRNYPSTTEEGIACCKKDGLIARDSVPSVVNFKMAPSYLKNILGGVIMYTDGAWAVLGGTQGATDENLVLIAQLTTSGKLSFELNIQVATPDGRMLRYVARDPIGDELTFPGLLHKADL